MRRPTKRIQARKGLTGEVLERRWLTELTFELMLSRPEGFDFMPGQRITVRHGEVERDYSLISAPEDDRLALYIRRVEGGRFSPYLADVAVGERLSFSGPHGYFTFLDSGYRAVFVATGTGIAPFVSMARSGVSGFYLLHGVRREEDLCYDALWGERAQRYVPCLSDASAATADPGRCFFGKVTDYLRDELPKAAYDFYLCGRGEMIRDAIHLLDESFPGSLIRTEIYY